MQSDSIRVPVKKIDDVSEMVGELLISLSLLNQNQNDDFHNIEMISEQLQKKVLSMRLFPIAGVYEKLKRQVRDISSKMNKQVNFITTGAQTEVDKNVVEEIFAPLTHIIRNSMDHGLEPLEIRKSKNKPEKGTIKLVTENRGDNVSIRIFDDGNGLNKEKILSKAIENKIIKPETVLSDNEIFNLIFQPGFSTADKVTDISGRGVGMDVVKKTVEKLDGKIFVSSETGKGSVFEIVLPLSASILDGLVVKLGNSKFIFPILKVKHTLTPELNNVKNIYENQGQFIVFENQTVPLICLGEFYKMEYKYKTPETAVILIVEYKNKYYGIMLDEILNKQKIVAKKVPEYFTETPGVKAGTILGDGSVGLILEPEEIVEKFINN
jgi:two-component system chemotaxis sensor kinase CheA